MSFEAPEPSLDDRRALRDSAGLCADCRDLQVLRSRTSTFVRCGLSDRDDRFPRYPPLPRYGCAGFRAADAEASGQSPGADPPRPDPT